MANSTNRLLMNRTVMRCLLLGFVISVFMHHGPLRAQPSDGEFSQELSQFLENALNRYRVPGIALTIIKDGLPFYSAGFGTADFDKKTNVDPSQTLFQVNSISKVLTTALILRLEDAGLLTTDDPISKWLPEINMRPELAPVQIRHLLTHTSGFDVRYLYWVTKSRKDHLSNQQLLNKFPPKQVANPGEIYVYNNLNLIIAGRIAELATATNFPELIQQQIFDPLNMIDSSVIEPKSMDRVTTVYAFQPRTFRFLKFPFRYVQGSSTASTISSARDMSNFMEMLLNDGLFYGKTILKKESALKMLNEQHSIEAGVLGHSFGFEKSLHKDWQVFTRRGLLLGAQSEMTILPGLKLGIFMAHNGHENTISEMTKAFLLEKIVKHTGTEAPTKVVDSQDKHINLEPGIYANATHSHKFLDRLALMLRPHQYRDIEVTGDKIKLGRVEYNHKQGQIWRFDESLLIVPSKISNPGEVFYEGVTPYERVYWFEDNLTHKIAILIILVLSIIYLLGIAGYLIKAKMKQTPTKLRMDTILLGCAFFLKIIFLASFWFTVMGMDPMELVMLTATDLWISILSANSAAILSVGAVVFIVRRVVTSKKRPLILFTNTAFVLAMLVMIFIWDYWNVLGWRI
jgi:CubicO group peptidase (beta-lactamase class C family)